MGISGIGISDKKENPGRTVVVGLGNTILSDDGVGIYISREIKKKLSWPDIFVDEASTGGLELLEYITGFQKAVIIDAVSTGKNPPGTVIFLTAEDLPGGSSLTRHQVSLSQAIELGRNIGMDLPSEILIFGVEVNDVTTFSEKCTPEVDRAIPVAAEKIISSLED